MNKQNYLILILVLSLSLLACDDTKTKPKTEPPVPLVGVVADGKIYYQSQCGTCHSSGDDRSTAFGATKDLSKVHVERIQKDMSDLGGVNVAGVIVPLMGRLTNIRPQRVADLKAYFGSL